MWEESLFGEGILDRIVFPRIRLGAGSKSIRVTADEIDLAIIRIITRRHKRPDTRHARACRPTIRRQIVDSGDVVSKPTVVVLAPEDENLSRWRIIHGRGHNGRLGHWRHCHPSVRSRIVTPDYVEGRVGGKGITAKSIKKRVVGCTRGSIYVQRHVANMLPLGTVSKRMDLLKA